MDGCCASRAKDPTPVFRRVLWVALIVNVVMFALEAVAGVAAESAALQADALDFFADAANYALSLSVLSLALAWRSRAAMVKGLSMGVFGVWVLIAGAINIASGATPHAITMGVVGFAALLANVGVAALLYRYRGGDANMRSVWLCSRNDAIGNAAVMVAALGVFGTGTLWPDIAVAAIMASLSLSAAFQTMRSATAELKVGAGAPVPVHVHHG